MRSFHCVIRRCILGGALLAISVGGGYALAQERAFDPFEAATRMQPSAEPEDIGPAPSASAKDPATPDPAAKKIAPTPLDLFSLLLKGRWLMVPIGLMSVMVIMLVIECALALRRSRVLPEPLLEGLAELGSVPGVMDPRCAYRLCQQYPSGASTVIRAMLLKIGRPHSEVEHAVAETSDREAERLYGNVRWLNLIAAVAPLTGLLGTVWGMIRAFYDTTQIAAGQNKADFLRKASMWRW